MNDNPPIVRPNTSRAFFEGDYAKEMAGLVADLTPVVGEGKAAIEAAEALRAGDYSEAAVSAIGIIPVIGPKAKALAKMYKASKKRPSKIDPELDVQPVSLYKSADTKKLAKDFENDNLPEGLIEGLEESGFDMGDNAADSMRELIQVLKESPEELVDADRWSRKVLYHVGRNYGVK